MARRDTPQQRSIRDAIESAGRPLSVREIHELALEASPTLGICTVYRVLRRLLDDQLVTTVQLPGQADRYEATSLAAEQHHHFRCEECDRVFNIEALPSGPGSMLPPGFTLVGHEISLWGRCSECATPECATR